MDESKIKTCFLAGKIGTPFWIAWLKFLFWDFILSMCGFHIWNPCRQIYRKTKWIHKLRICFEKLHDQDYIFVIPGWKKSKESQFLFDEAARLDKRIVYLTQNTYFRFLVRKFWLKNPPVPTFDGIDKILGDIAGIEK